jgi:hypothetical protein
MSNFTIIEDGGKGGDKGGAPNFHDRVAVQALRRLTVEILRAIARGDDLSGRIAENLVNLAEHMSATDTPFNTIVNGTVAGLHQNLLSKDPSDPEAERIVLASLKMAAETCADDGAAKGRSGKRDDTLTATIERYMINREQRSRENGWSYMGKLMDDWLPPGPEHPPKK